MGSLYLVFSLVTHFTDYIVVGDDIIVVLSTKGTVGEVIRRSRVSLIFI